MLPTSRARLSRSSLPVVRRFAPLAGFVLFTLVGLAAPGRSAERETVRLPGLSRPVEIVVDRWGIPHIYAATEDDLFFAQGWNAARDRLWQLDLWRRQGEGKLAEAFGPRFVEQDRAARLFLYRGDLEAELASYHPRARPILAAFTRGINAFVDLTQEKPNLLPLEFQLTGARPGHWSLTTPLVRLFGLTRNVGREVRLARLVHERGTTTGERLWSFEPPTVIEVPKGIDLSLLDDAVLGTYTLAHSGVTFRPEDLSAALPSPERARVAQALSRPGLDDLGAPRFESNNWAVAGRLTATGRPLLAGDPHRALSVPSLRYVAHLVGPGWNVIGAGEPALPGISLGHNERVAWALTIFAYADEEDLYVYETNPQDPRRYRYRGGWEDMRTIEEVVPVKSAPSSRVALRFTRHGPVLFEDVAHHRVYALRAAYLEHAGTAAYLASLRLDEARDWPEFVGGAERHFVPSLNMVYADVAGNVGWLGTSAAPLRKGWTGVLPVPGDGEYEWQGFLDPSELPRLLNPPAGWIGTANQYNLPAGYPHVQVSGREWAAPFRYRRIAEVLGSGRPVTVEDAMRLQYDDTSLPARELVPLLKGLATATPAVEAALRALRGWDFVLSPDSAPAAIYEAWLAELHKAVLSRYAPGERAADPSGLLSMAALVRILEEPDGAFGSDPAAGRDAVLLESLGKAVVRLEQALGPDASTWRWGRLHRVAIDHTLSTAGSRAPRETIDVAPLPLGGDGFTVHNTAYRESDYRQTSGATYRQVIDVGDWDRSMTLNAPGQSGDPRSPHYRDLFPLAAEGRYVPMVFSREKVMDAAERIITLEPIAR
jgi:penicillin G amidase